MNEKQYKEYTENVKYFDEGKKKWRCGGVRMLLP